MTGIPPRLSAPITIPVIDFNTPTGDQMVEVPKGFGLGEVGGSSHASRRTPRRRRMSDAVVQRLERLLEETDHVSVTIRVTPWPWQDLPPDQPWLVSVTVQQRKSPPLVFSYATGTLEEALDEALRKVGV